MLDLSDLVPFHSDSKTCLKWPIKNRQNKDLNDKYGSLMKVESIAECSTEHSEILLTCIKRLSVLENLFFLENLYLAFF